MFDRIIDEILSKVRAEARAGALEAFEEAMKRDENMPREELLERLEKSPAAFKQWLRRHPDFPALRTSRRLIFPRAACERWLAENGVRQRRRPAAPAPAAPQSGEG